MSFVNPVSWDIQLQIVVTIEVVVAVVVTDMPV
jgi:hypothetical protein